MFLHFAFTVCLFMTVAWLINMMRFWNDPITRWLRVLGWSTLAMWLTFACSPLFVEYPESDSSIAAFDASGRLTKTTRFAFVRCPDDQCMQIPNFPAQKTLQMKTGDRTADVYVRVSIKDPQQYFQTFIRGKQKEANSVYDVEKTQQLLGEMADWAFKGMLKRQESDATMAANLGAYAKSMPSTPEQIRVTKSVFISEMNKDLNLYGLSVSVQDLTTL